VGSVLRFALDGAVSARTSGGFPVGTLVVNLSGALVLGLLSGAGVGGDALRLVGTGFVGAYTTFSTWMYESQRLAEDGNGRAAFANVALSIVAGVLVAWIGIRIGREL
jgi:CrcB protein